MKAKVLYSVLVIILWFGVLYAFARLIPPEWGYSIAVATFLITLVGVLLAWWAIRVESKRNQIALIEIRKIRREMETGLVHDTAEVPIGQGSRRHIAEA